MKKILSTKKLKLNQRDLLLGANFSVVDYNAIEIEFLDFNMPSEIKNAIFTSQNGVKSFLKQNSLLLSPSEGEGLGVRIEKVFCVGQKTAALLEQNKLKATKTGQNSAELGDFITKNYKNEIFHYFCGSERRDELPNILNESKIHFFEVKSYKTTVKPKKFDQKWDGILFFSPTGVESFVLGNNLQDVAVGFLEGLSTMAICIGQTTAEAAKKYFKNVVIANATSVESVIAKAVKKLKK